MPSSTKTEPTLLMLMEADTVPSSVESSPKEASLPSRTRPTKKREADHADLRDAVLTQSPGGNDHQRLISPSLQTMATTRPRGGAVEDDLSTLDPSQKSGHALPESPLEPALHLAHQAHVMFRHQPIAELEALVRWVLTTGGQEEPSTQTIDHFAGALARHMGEAARTIGDAPNTIEEVGLDKDGLPHATACLIVYLTHLGPKGREVGEALRHHSKPTSPWSLWLRRSEKKPGTDVTRALAVAVWSDDVGPRIADSRPLLSVGVRHGEDDYAPMPKLSSPMSWALGGPGVDVASALRGGPSPGGVDVDGDRYAHEPDFVRDAAEVRSLVGAKLSRSYRLLPEGHEARPHHTSLSLQEEGESLPMTVAGSNGYVLSPHAAKLALLLLASDQVKRGGLATSSLRQLTERIYAGAKRIQSRDVVTTAEGLDELRKMFLYMPDNRKIQVFDVESLKDPEKARGDEVLRLGLTRVFCDELRQADSANGLRGPRLSGREYRGEFLVNLTGIMRLPNRQPALMRYYMRCAASWNASFRQGGEFDADKLPAMTVEKWAAIANDLPEGVVEYLAAQQEGRATTDRRRQLSMARQAARENLQLLKEQGLIRLHEDGKLVKPLPPEAYLEAWTQIRGNGRRPG